MLNLLENAVTYNDASWEMTFYFVAVLALLIGMFWTYYNVFLKRRSKKNRKELTENIIYNNPEDTIEESYKDNKKIKKQKKIK